MKVDQQTCLCNSVSNENVSQLHSRPLLLMPSSSAAAAAKLSVFSSSSSPSLLLLPTYGKFRLRANTGNNSSVFGGSSNRMKRLFNREEYLIFTCGEATQVNGSQFGSRRGRRGCGSILSPGKILPKFHKQGVMVQSCLLGKFSKQ